MQVKMLFEDHETDFSYIKKLNEQTSRFAKACYLVNTLEDLLRDMFDEDTKRHDCCIWGLTHKEWRQGIFAAAMALASDRIDIKYIKPQSQK